MAKEAEGSEKNFQILVFEIRYTFYGFWHRWFDDSSEFERCMHSLYKSHLKWSKFQSRFQSDFFWLFASYCRLSITRTSISQSNLFPTNFFPIRYWVTFRFLKKTRVETQKSTNKLSNQCIFFSFCWLFLL